MHIHKNEKFKAKQKTYRERSLNISKILNWRQQ